MGVLGLGMMGLDKGLAGLGNERISERSLFLLAFAGGFWGILLGRFVFHHKVSKPQFLVIPIFALILWVAGVAAYSLGLLRI